MTTELNTYGEPFQLMWMKDADPKICFANMQKKIMDKFGQHKTKIPEKNFAVFHKVLDQRSDIVDKLLIFMADISKSLKGLQMKSEFHEAILKKLITEYRTLYFDQQMNKGVRAKLFSQVCKDIGANIGAAIGDDTSLAEYMAVPVEIVAIDPDTFTFTVDGQASPE